MILRILFFLLIGSSLIAQHENILIDDLGNPNEPSICINPNNPSQMVAGCNLDFVYFSSDTGKTWVKNSLASSYGVWGDPAITVDTAGHFYFFHLSKADYWIDRIVCQKSEDGGNNWTLGSFMGFNPYKNQDKEWPVVDPVTNNIYVTWTQFDKYGSHLSADSSHIIFSRSEDGGETWLNAKRINRVGGDCVDDDNTVEGAVPAVGPNGEVYVCWASADGLMFDRSLDKGDTWLYDDIKICDMPGGWNYSIPGINRANGLPVTVCDLSDGENRGTIYVNWTDQRNGLDDTDVWLVKSIDGGDTWSAPIRVNDDLPGRHQFFTWMTVDNVTGYLYFVFYDRRNYSNNYTDVYMAVSKDGGNTFTNFKISESPFNPNSNIFFGDYTNITAYNNIVRPIWGRMDGYEMSVWTAIVDVDSITTSTNEQKFSSALFDIYQNVPNPYTDNTAVPFKLRKASVISLSIYDFMGNKVYDVIKEQKYPYGKHIIKVDNVKYKLNPGIYLYSLSIDNMVKSIKTIVLD